ncbi:hypothetical protein WOLCODRAFT_61079, partial [Wolfiporia cocos MD-104 SS10]
AMAPALTVTYELHPPPNAIECVLPPKQSHDFPVSPTEDAKAYYEALRLSIAQAKTKLGEELTIWRDAVGSREQAKESTVPKKEEEDEGEDEDEEGGEE